MIEDSAWCYSDEELHCKIASFLSMTTRADSRLSEAAPIL